MALKEYFDKLMHRKREKVIDAKPVERRKKSRKFGEYSIEQELRSKLSVLDKDWNNLASEAERLNMITRDFKKNVK